LTNKQIAKELEVSPETIKKHLKSIFEKSTVRQPQPIGVNLQPFNREWRSTAVLLPISRSPHF